MRIVEKNKSKELHNHEYLHEKDTGNVHYLNEEKKKRTIRATKLNYRSSIRVDKISESTGAKRPAGIIRGTSSYLGGDKANMVDIDNVSKKGKLTAPYNTEIYGKSSTAFGSKPKGKDTTICIKNIEPSGLVWGFVPEFDKKGADYLDEINYPKEKKENHIDMDMDVLAKHNNEVTTFSNLEQPELLSKYSTSTVHMDDLSKVILPREDWYDSSYLNILDEIKELKDEIETETNTLNLLTIKQMEMNTSLQKMENTLRQLETEENEEINIQSGYKMASEFDDHLKETVLELQYLSDSLQEDIDFNSFKDREISKSDYKSVFQYIDVTAKSITNTFNQECKDLDMFPSNAVKKLPNVSRFSGMQGI
ncbi:hypothetical protein AX774_g6850 [Zancudomyces culisetae]|uniref:Uncharacterized protein n=1 Tax=Zancudomyces culisetae TaxID=1213189 RepID=A0A1R1PFN1_ZANCU|nr:hypothetical protein AX774_g6850 [Zancudomyces culisetae]|eukprot:OMH79729.1 hypothetical protein AX774_g6850 [Zancudomyces culisetae]